MIADILDVLPICFGSTWCIGAIVRPISHENGMEIVALNLETWNRGLTFCLRRAAVVLESTPPDMAT